MSDEGTGIRDPSFEEGHGDVGGGIAIFTETSLSRGVHGIQVQVFGDCRFIMGR